MSSSFLETRIGFMAVLVCGSFIVAGLTATAANAAPAKAVNSPKAPKGASVEFRLALAGVQCSELHTGDWAIKGDAGEALERLSIEEAKSFDTMMAKWAKKACTTDTTTVKGE